MSKTIPFVHSRFKRRKGELYKTVDPRCTYAFLEHFQPKGFCVDVCSPDGSGIVDTLIACEYHAFGIGDAFKEIIAAEWIITNPPYKRPLVDQILWSQIKRVQTGQVAGFAALMRAYFDHAKIRRPMFEDCPDYWGQIKLRFRPLWKKKKPGDKGPIHNFVWHIWKPGYHEVKHLLYADGIKELT